MSSPTRNTQGLVAIVLSLVFVTGLLIALLPGRALAATSVMGIQFSDNGLGNDVGTIRNTPSNGGASGWASDSNNFDPDSVRIYLDGFRTWTQDIRVGIQTADRDGNNSGCTQQIRNPVFTPWATEGGGNSQWSTDANAYDPNCGQLIVETRPLPQNAFLGDMRVGIQVSDHACRAETGVMRYTPWAVANNGGWSAWAGDSNYYDPDCYLVRLEPQFIQTAKIRVETLADNGAGLQPTWKIRHKRGTSNGGTTIIQSTGARVKTYDRDEGIFLGKYQIYDISPTIVKSGKTYNFVNVTPSDTQSVGTVGECQTDKSGPHAQCSGGSCGGGAGCGWNDCAACSPSSWIWSEPSVAVEKILEKITEFIKPKVAHAIFIEDVDGEPDFCRFCSGQYCVTGNTAAQCGGSGGADCFSHADCGGPTTPPSVSINPPTTPPSAPEITFNLNYELDTGGGTPGGGDCQYTTKVRTGSGGTCGNSTSCLTGQSVNLAVEVDSHQDCALSTTNGARRFRIDNQSGGAGDSSYPFDGGWTNCWGPGSTTCNQKTAEVFTFNSPGTYTVKGSILWRQTEDDSSPLEEVDYLTITVTDPVTRTLTLTKSGTGQGTVTSVPSGINCGTSCSSDTGTFNDNENVTLDPVPDANSTFAGWSGNSDCNDYVVTMNANKTCNAIFNTLPPNQRNLSVTINGTANGQRGRVTGPGINCGYSSTGDCSELYDTSTPVTLTADANVPGWAFNGWVGCDSTAGTTCNLTMNSNRAVDAQFTSDVLYCSPGTQNAQTDQSVNLSATNGTGTYSWSAPGGAPSTGSGSNFATSYSTAGTKTITLTSGSETDTCSVVVSNVPPETCTPSCSSTCGTYAANNGGTNQNLCRFDVRTVVYNGSSWVDSVTVNPGTNVGISVGRGTADYNSPNPWCITAAQGQAASGQWWWRPWQYALYYNWTGGSSALEWWRTVNTTNWDNSNGTPTGGVNATFNYTYNTPGSYTILGGMWWHGNPAPSGTDGSAGETTAFNCDCACVAVQSIPENAPITKVDAKKSGDPDTAYQDDELRKPYDVNAVIRTTVTGTAASTCDSNSDPDHTNWDLYNPIPSGGLGVNTSPRSSNVKREFSVECSNSGGSTGDAVTVINVGTVRVTSKDDAGIDLPTTWSLNGPPDSSVTQSAAVADITYTDMSEGGPYILDNVPNKAGYGDPIINFATASITNSTRAIEFEIVYPSDNSTLDVTGKIEGESDTAYREGTAANPLVKGRDEGVHVRWVNGNLISCTALAVPQLDAWDGSRDHSDGTFTSPPIDSTVDREFRMTCTSNSGNLVDSLFTRIAECSDGINNDTEDTLIDEDDPGCHTDGDPDDGDDSYDPRDDDESNNTPQCNDGFDNNDPEDDLPPVGDGTQLADYPADPGCESINDNDETDLVLPECIDGIDNDGDGEADFPNDPECLDAQDDDEGGDPRFEEF